MLVRYGSDEAEIGAINILGQKISVSDESLEVTTMNRVSCGMIVS